MRRELVAVNTAPDSENRMHGDEAKRYGFTSGLVPGVDVLAYLAHEGVARWGAPWLAGGRLTGRLAAPVYDGETIAVETEVPALADAGGADGAIVSRVVGTDGSERASATLSLLDASSRGNVLERADPAAFTASPVPVAAARPAAAADLLAPGTVLATQRATFRADRAPGYLAEISEDDAVFLSGGAAHPGWLLRFANWALSRTVRLGPWIHVSSDAWLLGAVHDGDELEVRAHVTDRFERKGHEFVDLDVLYLVAGAPVAFVDHRAIWQPRARD